MAKRVADDVPPDKRAVVHDVAIRAEQSVNAVTITYTQTTYTVTQTRAVTAPVGTTTENGERRSVLRWKRVLTRRFASVPGCHADSVSFARREALAISTAGPG